MFLGTHTANFGMNGNLAFSKARRDGHIDLIQTGARQSDEAGCDLNMIDVEAELAIDRRSPGEALAGRDSRSGRAKTDTIKLHRIAGLSGDGAIAEAIPRWPQDVVGSTAVRSRTVLPQDDSGDVHVVNQTQ